ncbi:MAG: hypothetical protein NTW08_03580 [Gammaproteobacteria bacterium]|nr:hypothetical protein [Gammaproteobacteria bacterium]
MPTTIKIIKLTSQELIIEPFEINTSNNAAMSRPSSLPQHDLSFSWRALKQDLEEHAGLIEGQDYTVSEPPLSDDIEQHFTGKYQCRIIFSGKSLVVRALYSIPLEHIIFPFQMGDSTFTKEIYKQERSRYALSLSARDCFAFDIKFKTQADDDLFAFLKTELQTIHDKIKTPSAVIAQLKVDIHHIETQLNQDIFVLPKCLAAFSSIMYAILVEQEEPTVCKTYLGGFLNGASILAPEYQTLMQSVNPWLRSPLSQLPKEAASGIYHKYVNTSQMTTTSSSSASSLYASQ